MARTTIPPELVAVNAIQGTLIADNSVTAVHIATNAISGTLVADNSITSTHIAQNQVTATQIAQNTITVTQMADSAIETAKINADAVTGAKIADNAIDSEHYTDGSIDTAHIADLQVTAAKIGANAVTLAKMASLTRGSILIGNSAADVSALAIGSNGYVLTSDGTDAAWAAASGGLSTSGGTLTGDLAFGDDLKIKMGASTGDLELYHIGGSVSVLRSTPALVIQSDDYISLGTYSDGELMLKATKNGSTDLYYDNLVKLQTTDKGCLVQSAGAKDVTIGMSNGGVDWHIGIDDSAGDYFRLGKHSGMGNNPVYTVTPAFGHRFEGAHQGDTIGTWIFDNQNLGDSTSTNCTLMVKNGNAQVQIMPWSTLGARVGTRGGGWNSNSNNACHLTSNDAANIILNTNGSPTLANGTAISSDERLKKDIIDIGDGQLAKINALKPRTFKWKDTRKTGTQEGFIAQEVESVMPEAVEEREVAPDPDDTTRDFGNDIKVLKHEVINARLIKAVQELSAELDAAKARISALEG